MEKVNVCSELDGAARVTVGGNAVVAPGSLPSVSAPGEAQALLEAATGAFGTSMGYR